MDLLGLVDQLLLERFFLLKMHYFRNYLPETIWQLYEIDTRTFLILLVWNIIFACCFLCLKSNTFQRVLKRWKNRFSGMLWAIRVLKTLFIEPQRPSSAPPPGARFAHRTRIAPCLDPPVIHLILFCLPVYFFWVFTMQSYSLWML